MKIIGHRGARGLAPENTIASLQKALEYHVDMVEFDLRVTGDGAVILHHDRHVFDPNGQKHLISKCGYAELKQHKPNLATFEEALEAVGGRVPLYIEVKPGEPVPPIAKTLKVYLKKNRSEDLWLASFSQKTLLELHDALPEVHKSVNEHWSGVRASFRARQLGTRYIMIWHGVLWWGFIRSMSRRGYHLSTYPLNNVGKARRWEKYGLYAVCTDYPDRFDK